MVSTNSAQYITDFSSSPAEPGKSPLALLAKTCETIGLPETLSKTNAVSERKEDKRLDHYQTKQKSPRSTPSSKEPTMTFPGLVKPSYPLGIPGIGFPLFNPLFPYQMPFSSFSLNPASFMGASGMLQCPFAMMRQPCANPSCAQCSVKSPAAPEVMAQFASHPFFSMYSNMNASRTSHTRLAPTPATPSSSKDLSVSSEKTDGQNATKFECNWIEAETVCGKKFAEESELSEHFKKEHSSSAAHESRTRKMSSRSNATPERFNPYRKGSMPTRSASVIPSIIPTPAMFPFSLQTVYANRLLSPVAHQ